MTFEAGRHIREIELDGAHPTGNPMLEIIVWRARFGSELVLCGGDGIPLATFPAQVSTADADFTALVTWPGFDPDDFDPADPDHEAYLPVLARVRSAIRDCLAEQAPEQAPGRTPPDQRFPGSPEREPAHSTAASR